MTLINKTGAVLAVIGLMATVLVSFATPVRAQSVNFTSDLTIGSTGAQVTALQTFLIGKGFTIPAGATGYFGAQTRAAIAAFQSANGIAPAVGYFGPVTRAKVNASASTPTPGNGSGTNDSSGLKGGEASLERFRMNDGNDNDISEGGRGEIAEIEFRVEDGDVRMNRLDLTFSPDSLNDEKKPWKTFDTVRLLVNGKEIAEADVSDEDDWLKDNAPYVFRFTGINQIFREGKVATVVVEADVQNGVLDAGSTDSWTVYVDEDGVRATDSENLTQEIGSASETVTFDVTEEGAGEDLTIRTSSEDPDATTLKVEDDTRSDWYTVFAFDLEAGEGDIDLNDVAIDFTSGTANVQNIVDDVMLVVDGEEFDDYRWNGSGTFASTTFDVDGDYTVSDGDRVEVEVKARFKSANGSNYNPGETIRASVNGAQVEGEGADDLTADGSATGDVHTLGVSGISGSRGDRSAVTTVADGADNDYATFRVDVDITAFEEDAFIPENAIDAFTFEIQDASTGAVLGTSTATTSSLTSSADTQGGYYRINENDTEEFSFMVTLNPLPENESKNYRMRLVSVHFADTASTPDQTWTALPANVYQTTSTYIND